MDHFQKTMLVQGFIDYYDAHPDIVMEASRYKPAPKPKSGPKSDIEIYNETGKWPWNS